MILEAIESRRSVRRFRPDEVPGEAVEAALRAALLAPSAKNDQPWRFLVLGERSRERALDAMDAGIRLRMRDEARRPMLASAIHTLRVMRNAPVLILIEYPGGGNPSAAVEGSAHILEQMDLLSIGAAVENLILEATARGLGSLWIGNTVFAHDEMVGVLGLSGQLIGAVALGYPDESPAPRPRKPETETIVRLP